MSARDTSDDNRIWKPDELLFSARARCRCGSGLAYPIAFEFKKHRSEWICAAVLLGEIADIPEEHGKHDAYPFSLYEIKSEDQPSAAGATTRRPEQGHVEWRLHASCKKCGAKWTSDLRRPSVARPWAVVPCPGCGTSHENPDGSSNLDVDVRAESVVVIP